MAYPEHYLAQFGGSLRGDIWSIGIRFLEINSAPGSLDGDDQDGRAEDFFAKFLTYMKNNQSMWSNAAVLQYCKFNAIDGDGHYQDSGTTHAFYGTPGQALDVSQMPNQIALAVSWRTPADRGLASKGRMYVPVPLTQTIDPVTGEFQALSALQAGNAAAGLINALNDGPALSVWQLQAHVVSRGKRSGSPGNYTWGQGAAHAITGVRVGRVFDTMRSRRNALNEEYVNATTAVPTPS